jgi:surfactin synthase thioesterase subunit
VDDVQETPSKMLGWREHTTSAFLPVSFPGGHFFLHQQSTAVVAQLSRELQRITAAPR